METVETLEEFDMSADGNVFLDIEVDYFPSSYDIKVEIVEEV